MGEFKRGSLHSGKKGPVVKSRQQAKAIAMSVCHEESDFSCTGGCGGKCGCPNCKDMKKKKSNMMALGYSEEAVDAVLDDLENRYGEKRGLWAISGANSRFSFSSRHCRHRVCRICESVLTSWAPEPRGLTMSKSMTCGSYLTNAMN